MTERTETNPDGELKQQIFSDHKWLNLDEEEAAIYNCWDLIATARVYPKTIQELKDNRQYDFFIAEVWPLIRPILDMQRRGLRVDREAKTQYRRQLRRELKEVDGEIFKVAGRDLNLDSNPQVGQLLYEDFGLKCHKLTDSGKPSVDQEALTRCLRNLRKRDEPYRVVLENLFHRSKLQTIDERYIEMDIDEDGRVRPTIKLVGTETGRFAYTNPPLQQFPDDIRHIIVADPDSVFIAADYSQLEARIMAYYSHDTPSLKIFSAGGDIHAGNAKDLFGYSGEQWHRLPDRKKKEARNFAKSDLYRRMYGGSATSSKMRLSCPCPRCIEKSPPTVELSRKDMEKADRRWNRRHPSFNQWRKKLVREVAGRYGTGWYTNALGRRRRFMGPYGAVEREVYNMPMQSTAADIINRALVRGSTQGIPFVLQLHDSLMAEVPENQAHPIAAQLKQLMEQPVPEMDNMVFPVDVSIGKDWGGLKPWTTVPERS